MGIFNIPDKVKIGGQTYVIKPCEFTPSGRNCLGEIEYENQIIYLKESQHEENKCATFIHELFHGLIDTFSREYNSEELIRGLSSAFHALLVDNPGLFNIDKPEDTSGRCADEPSPLLSGKAVVVIADDLELIGKFIKFEHEHFKQWAGCYSIVPILCEDGDYKRTRDNLDELEHQADEIFIVRRSEDKIKVEMLKGDKEQFQEPGGPQYEN